MYRVLAILGMFAMAAAQTDGPAYASIRYFKTDDCTEGFDVHTYHPTECSPDMDQFVCPSADSLYVMSSKYPAGSDCMGTAMSINPIVVGQCFPMDSVVPGVYKSVMFSCGSTMPTPVDHEKDIMCMHGTVHDPVEGAPVLMESDGTLISKWCPPSRAPCGRTSDGWFKVGYINHGSTYSC